MRKILFAAALVAVVSSALFGCSLPTEPKTETQVVYVEDAQEVMIGMIMSGRYKDVSGTNDNGKWTITATLR